MPQTAPAPATTTETLQSEGPNGDYRPVILHVIAGLSVGGAERMLEKLATSPAAYRHVVVSLSGKGPVGLSMEAAGVEVHVLEVAGLSGLVRGLRQLGAIARALRPVAIQGWMTHGNIFASLLRLAGLWRVPLFWGVRQSVDLTGERPRTKVLIYLSALLARTPKEIVYNSETGAIQHEKIGYPRAKRRVIPNGFDLEKYRPSAKGRAAIRSAHGVGDDELLIGMVARVHPVKNHRGFLAAAAILAAEHRNVRFLLAGRGVDSSDEAFAALVAEAGIDPGRLILLEEVSDVASVMCGLDIAANVSIAESFPNAVGEALACGVPCVVTPAGGSAILVGDGGIVCAGTDGRDIADAIRKLIDEGPEERATRSVRAIERIRDHFSLPSVVARFDDLYDSVHPA